MTLATVPTPRDFARDIEQRRFFRPERTGLQARELEQIDLRGTQLVRSYPDLERQIVATTAAWKLLADDTSGIIVHADLGCDECPVVNVATPASTLEEYPVINDDDWDHVPSAVEPDETPSYYPFDDPDDFARAGATEFWLPTAAEIGLNPTRPDKRPTFLDETDDEYVEFPWGFTLVSSR